MSVRSGTDAAGASTGDRLLTAALFDGTVNTDTDVFEAWTEQALLPVLPNGSDRCHGQCRVPYI